MAIFLPLLLLAVVMASAYASHRWGLWTAAAIVPVAALFFFTGDRTGEALTYITPLIMGTMGGFAVKKKLPLKHYTVITSLAVASLFTADYYYLKQVKNIDIITESRAEMVNIVNASGMERKQKEEMLADFDRMMDLMRNIIPFSAFIYALFFSALNFIVVKLFLSRVTGDRPGKGLEFFALNEYLIFGLIAGLGSLVLADRESNPLIFTAALNAALIIVTLYLVQGLGVLKFFMMKRGLPDYLLYLSVIMLILLGRELTMFLLVLLAGFGTLDLWADFRKINTRKTGTDSDK